jgi:transcriptional antiterminator Rof (Rho-off)
MTLNEIKQAIIDGKTVHVSTDSYRVVGPDEHDQWHIKCTLNDHYIGLTHCDGVTMNAKPEEFYVK